MKWPAPAMWPNPFAQAQRARKRRQRTLGILSGMKRSRKGITAEQLGIDVSRPPKWYEFEGFHPPREEELEPAAGRRRGPRRAPVRQARPGIFSVLCADAKGKRCRCRCHGRGHGAGFLHPNPRESCSRCSPFAVIYSSVYAAAGRKRKGGEVYEHLFKSKTPILGARRRAMVPAGSIVIPAPRGVKLWGRAS